VINQVCTAPSLPEPSLPPVSHSHKGRSRAVVADEEEDNEANWNPPSSAATASVVPGLTYEEYERAIRHDLRKKQKSQGASSNPDQAPEAGRLRIRSSSGAGTLFPFIPPDDSTDFFQAIAATFFLFHCLPTDNIKHQQRPRLLDRGETCTES